MSRWDTGKRILLGRPLASAEEHHERLPKKFALPVFSADAISSTAYATEEILLALIAAGTAALVWSPLIALAVAGLLAIVALSYRQTVHAYPNGGGSYQVSRTNLGLTPGMIAAASLMVGYVATVAVSISSGVAAITSAFPAAYGYRVWICIAMVILIAVANLRGVRESGRIFAAPTYLFVLLCAGLVIAGLVRWLLGDLPVVTYEQTAETVTEGAKALTAFIVLRAFASGCVAMTGTEAIANAVPDFKAPESKNAAQTLAIMAGLLGFLLLGVTVLAQVAKVQPIESDTVLSQISRLVYGDGSFFYYALQIATMAILVIGANTCYAGFPRLSSVMARDGLMPRQFMNRGDRLVFSNGIVGLTLASIVIIVVFNADTHRIIPFYALGVFIGFTLSQAGMVIHWHRLHERRWVPKAIMNAFGAFLTGAVGAVILYTKFTEGAWIVVASVPVLVGLFYLVMNHYRKIGRALEPQSRKDLEVLGLVAGAVPRSTAVVFVAQVNYMTARALAIAKAVHPDELRVVTISNDAERSLRLQSTWAELGMDVPLEVIDSPYREFVGPALDYVKSLDPNSKHWVTVFIPEFVVEHWWEELLHNQDARRLKISLLRVPWVGVMSVPLHVGAMDKAKLEGPAAGAGE